jgi:hypothetical protein
MGQGEKGPHQVAEINGLDTGRPIRGAFCGFELSSRWEQAKTPGEKNMGVAVLFMAFGIPMLISGLSGLLCLMVSILMFAYRRFCSRISN